MGTVRKFILKFGVTVCLLAVLLGEGFFLYCHYVKHVDAIPYASEKLRSIREWIGNGGTQTASAKSSDVKASFPEDSITSDPYLFVSAKEAVGRILESNRVVIPEKPKVLSDSGKTADPEAENARAAKAGQSKRKAKAKHVPAESADPTGMETTDISDLLKRQTDGGAQQDMDSHIQLDAESILQNPELPTGCEITSLAMALLYSGYHVSKEELADQYLEKAPPGTVSYRTAFWGDPRKEDSFGCYAPVIVKAANQFLAKKKSPHMAYNLTGTPLDDLLAEIRMGYPVIVWGSMYIDGEIIFSYGWEIDGETVTWPSNEHCMLLIGFDTESNSVIVCDPLAGITSYDKNAFQHHYETLEQQAIVIY